MKAIKFANSLYLQLTPEQYEALELFRSWIAIPTYEESRAKFKEAESYYPDVCEALRARAKIEARVLKSALDKRDPVEVDRGIDRLGKLISNLEWC